MIAVSELLHVGSIPWPGIKPRSPALGAWSLSHWTTREVLRIVFLQGRKNYLKLLEIICSTLLDDSAQFLWNIRVFINSSTLAWKIPWTEEPGRLQSMGSLKVGHDWATSLSLFHLPALEKEMATHFSVLTWRIPGTGEPGGLPSMGLHRVGHDWSDLA